MTLSEEPKMMSYEMMVEQIAKEAVETSDKEEAFMKFLFLALM